MMANSCPKMQPLRNLKCSMCSKVYNNEKLLLRHVYKHEHPKQFLCSDCNKTFPTKTRLNIHSRIHSGDRPFKCAYCPIYFASRFQLKLHQRRHTGEKPYSCTFCEKEFSSSSGLRQHVKTHTKESPFSCKQCSKSFKQKEKLTQHERIHTGVRPFMCDQCPKTFRIKNALVRHLRIHSGDTYKCALCPKEFGELYALKKHHRKQHEKMQFTGPSERVSSDEKTNSRNIPLCDDSNLVEKTKRSRSSKNRLKGKPLKQRKRQIKQLDSDSGHKLTASNCGISKDVFKKLYLEIGQRDSSAVVDENGWHRIPLSAAIDLLTRNMRTFKKSFNGCSKEISVSVTNGTQSGKPSGQDSAECELNKKIGGLEELQQVPEQQGGATSTIGSEVLSSGIHQLVPEEAKLQTHENTAVLSVCQQTEQASIAGRRRREITHPSTIDYFPTADQTPGPVYAQEGESFQFLKNSVCEPATTNYLQNPPYKVWLVCDLQEPDFNRGSFKGGGALSDRFCSMPNYHQHHFRPPDHEQKQPANDNRSFDELHRQSDRIPLESDHRPKATLHHRPDPYQQNFPHEEPYYYSHEPQYSNTSVPEIDQTHPIDLDCLWHDHHIDDVHDLTPFNNKNPRHMQPPHYQQPSSCVLHAPLASFTASPHPTLSSAVFQQDPLPIPQNSAFSLMPYQQSSFERNSSHLTHQHGSHLQHQNELCESNQREFLTSNQPFQNQQCLIQKESLTLNQPFQNQPCLHQKESLTSSQPFQNQQCLIQKESLTLNQPFQNQPCLNQKESLTSSQPFQNQQCLIQKESLTSSQPFQNQQQYLLQKESVNQILQNESLQSNQLLLQQHLSTKQIQPLLDQHESAKSNQQEQLLCNYNFSTRTNISSQQSSVISTNTNQETRQTVVMFSHSESSVIHHKPVPIEPCGSQIDACSTEAWPVYFQMQQSHLNPHNDLDQSFSRDATNISMKTSTCGLNKEACASNHHQISNHLNLDLPMKASFKNMLDCIVPENSNSHRQGGHYTSLDLPQGTSFKSVPGCSVTENSNSQRQSGHHTSLDLPQGTSFKSVPGCSVPENSNSHRQSGHHTSLDLPQGTSFKSVPGCSVPENSNSHRQSGHHTNLDLPQGTSFKSVSGCIIAENSNSYRQSGHHTSLDLPQGTSFKSVSGCSVPENSNSQRQSGHHTNLDLPQGTSFKSVPGCSVPENSNSQHQSGHRINLNLPIKASFKSVPDCSVPENSNKSLQNCHRMNLHLPIKASFESVPDLIVPENSNSHRQSSHRMNLDMPKTAYFKSEPECIIPENSYFIPEPIQVFTPGSNDLPRSNFSTPKQTIQSQFPICSLSLSNCLDWQSKSAADCSDVAKEDELLTINTFSGEFNRMQSQFACITTPEEMIAIPDIRKNNNLHAMNHNFGYKSCKLITKIESFSNILTETSEMRKNKEKLFDDDNFHVGSNGDDNDFDVGSNEDDNEVGCQNTNGVQLFLKKETIENREKVLTTLNADVGQNGIKDMILSGKSKSELIIKTRPARSECFSKYRDSSKRDTRGCHGVTQNLAPDSEYLNNSRPEKNIEPSGRSFGNLKLKVPESKNIEPSGRSFGNLKLKVPESKNIEPSGRSFGNLKLKVPESKISDSKRNKLNKISKQINNNCSKEFNRSLCNENLVCDIICPDTEYVKQKKGRQNGAGNLSEESKDMKKEEERDNNFGNSKKNLICGSVKLKSSFSKIDVEGKVDFIERKSAINQKKNFDETNLRRKEGEQEIARDNQDLTKNFDDLRHQCKTCGKKFPNNFRLQRHVKTHVSQKPYPCSICPQAFTTKRYLDNHMSRHDKEPPIFACGECGKTFPGRYRLKIHFRTHTGEKPYKCSRCSSYFTTSFQVRLHERVHSDNLQFQCRFCGKCFRSNTTLSLHVKRHTNDKPYLCATCGATFYEASKLKAHIRVHTGVHPFMCDQCPKTFKVKHLLVRHLRWHNGDTFKCQLCSKPFDERWILKAHLQRHHSER